MTSSNNPTAVSAVVGEELELGRGGSPNAELIKNLVMPAILVVFASYLLFGMLTMRVPEGVAFPGPKFFPAIITVGLYAFALLLALEALKGRREAVARAALDTDELLLLTDEEAEPAKQVGLDWASLAWLVGSFVAFALLLKYLGWVVGAALLFWCVARAFGSKRSVFNLVVGVTASSIAYILFDMLLGLTLPSGVLGWGF